MEIINERIDPSEFQVTFKVRGGKISVRLRGDLIEIEGTDRLGIKSDKSDRKIGKLIWVGIREEDGK